MEGGALLQFNVNEGLSHIIHIIDIVKKGTFVAKHLDSLVPYLLGTLLASFQDLYGWEAAHCYNSM